MKHVANRSKSTVKAKTKTLAQIEPITKTKSLTKRSNGGVILNAAAKSSARKITPVAVKAVPKKSLRVDKSTIKKAAPKSSPKTLNAIKAISAGKVKPAAKQIEKAKAKKVALKTPRKTVKTSAQKTKTLSSTKKISAVEKNIKKSAAEQKLQPEITSAKPKVSLKTSANPVIKTSIKAAQPQPSKVAVRTTKLRQSKVITVVGVKIKSAVKKAKSIVAEKKPKNIKAAKPIVTAKIVKSKKTTPTVSTKKVNQKTKKLQSTVAAKKIVKKAVKAQAITAKKKGGEKIQKLKPAISAVKVKKQSPKIKKTIAVEKIRAVENIIEATQSRLQKPKNKKAKPISSAVFRGKKERYDFKVFALNEKFEPIPGVYIISKRKTDRHKRGHHALICIGETASISEELKRHRKGKCVKKHEANVVSILPEANEKMRLKIETDLKAAHAVICNLD